MSNDPLDAVFVTGDEAAELKRADTVRKLATYLERMPAELRGLFTEQFQRISIAELDQLRATIAEQARQLEAAREVIKRCSAYIGSIDHGENTKSYMMCDDWLAANPAPQEPQT